MGELTMRQHKFRVGSKDDERLRDRVYLDGKRRIAPYKLPVRRVFIVESKRRSQAYKRVAALAAASGLNNPIVISVEMLLPARKA
jgi:hypothetical protein